MFSGRREEGEREGCFGKGEEERRRGVLERERRRRGEQEKEGCLGCCSGEGKEERMERGECLLKCLEKGAQILARSDRLALSLIPSVIDSFKPHSSTSIIFPEPSVMSANSLFLPFIRL